VRWIDLNDPSGAKLKLANINIDGEEVRHLFIVNLSWRNESWEKAQRVWVFVVRKTVNTLCAGSYRRKRSHSVIFARYSLTQGWLMLRPNPMCLGRRKKMRAGKSMWI